MMLHGVEQYKQTRVAIVSSICSLKLTANCFAHTYITADAHWTALCMTEIQSSQLMVRNRFWGQAVLSEHEIRLSKFQNSNFQVYWHPLLNQFCLCLFSTVTQPLIHHNQVLSFLFLLPGNQISMKAELTLVTLQLQTHFPHSESLFDSLSDFLHYSDLLHVFAYSSGWLQLI